MAAWPTLKEVRSLLRMQPDPNEDALIDSARLAAIGYGIGRLGSVIVVADDGTIISEPRYPADTDTLPDTAHQAALLHSARLYRRRDSLDGTLGWGDAGVVRVGRFDPDVSAMYDTIGPVVFG